VYSGNKTGISVEYIFSYFTLNIEAIGFSEMSTDFLRSTWRHIEENGNIQYLICFFFQVIQAGADVK
jgi:hypothetical protein